jgi:hypothetical protein
MPIHQKMRKSARFQTGYGAHVPVAPAPWRAGGVRQGRPVWRFGNICDFNGIGENWPQAVRKEPGDDMSDADNNNSPADLVIDTLTYDPARGLIFRTAARRGEEARAVPTASLPAEIAMTLHYEGADSPARAIVTRGPRGFEIVLALEDTDTPLRAISCDLPRGVTLDRPLAAFLRTVFPQTNDAFEQLMNSKTKRFGDAPLQYFVARQISTGFGGLHAYRAASSVIMAYKAIEMEATALQREALAHVTAHLARIDECATTGHPRTDREHLLVSLLCAQWHLELSLGETEAFLATLDRCRAVAAELENHFTPAFNLSLALLIRCVLLSRAGDASGAGEIAAEGMQLFKRAVADATDKLTLFQELRMSHRNVHVMLQAASPSKRIKPDYDAWVLFSLRVRGAPAERLKDAALAIADARSAG